ncbi:MAG: carboxypeptidase M32 [Planctomyces sp.]|nr:carboxypeptidase M32 [Planctomyces sp.]
MASRNGTSAPAARSDHHAQLLAHLGAAGALASVAALIGWDQETYMPPAAAAARAAQAEELSRVVHQRRTDPRLGALLRGCQADPALARPADGPTAASLRQALRDYDRLTRLPEALVAELAKAGSLAQEAWKKARAENDFAAFAPHLERMLELTRHKARKLAEPAPAGTASAGTATAGPSEPYDALLDEYEPGATAAQLETVFEPLRARLSGLVARVAPRSRASALRPLAAVTRRTTQAAQHALGRAVLGAVGFDLDAGRLDVTAHPFCSGIAAGDTRLTTRYTAATFLEPLYATLHEGGHGLYEQGLPKAEHPGTPLSEAVSLGVHESQSRLWENFVGRSRAFWRWALPLAKKTLGAGARSLTLDAVYAAANHVRPSLIRVEADEATYNLHVMVRFRLERELIAGDLRVRDLPRAWNTLYRDILGVRVPDDRRGCLQDVHWSFGLIGYFPTYTLGNLYAAQLWEAVRRDVPTLEGDIARGRFGGLLGWLRQRIHRHGRRYTAAELCQRATGAALSPEPLLRHLEGKLLPLHGLGGARRRQTGSGASAAARPAVRTPTRRTPAGGASTRR